ncbi:MAG: hypothetical protein V4671_22635 [Armatimonadota bacterium]
MALMELQAIQVDQELQGLHATQVSQVGQSLTLFATQMVGQVEKGGQVDREGMVAKEATEARGARFYFIT